MLTDFFVDKKISEKNGLFTFLSTITPHPDNSILNNNQGDLNSYHNFKHAFVIFPSLISSYKNKFAKHSSYSGT